MLLDCDRELLTAYVDGELNSRERRHVDELLERSREARTLLLRLRADADALRSVAPTKLDIDLTPTVLNSIGDPRRLPAGRRRPKPLASGFPVWIGVAMAASVLCVVGLGSYLGFGALLSHEADQQQRESASRTAPAPAPEKTPPRESKPEQKSVPQSVIDKPEVARNAPVQPFVGPAAPNREESPPVVAKLPPEKKTNEIKPEPVGPKFTGRSTERFELEKVVVTNKPVILKVHDLDQAATRQKLSDALTKEHGYRVELPCDNGSLAFERLQSACKELKFNVLIDQAAQLRLKKPALRTSYVLYLENVTTEELSRLLQQIGAEDKKAAAYFDRLVLKQLTAGDYREVAELLGVEAAKIEPPQVSGPLGTDLRKPFQEQTGEQVAQALDGKKTAEGVQGLVLSYIPALSGRNSAEVKRFLDARKPGKPNTVRAIIVLRNI